MKKLLIGMMLFSATGAFAADPKNMVICNQYTDALNKAISDADSKGYTKVSMPSSVTGSMPPDSTPYMMICVTATKP